MGYIINFVKSNILTYKEVVTFLSDIKMYDSYTYRHSINVCVLALIIGKRLGLNSYALQQLGIGAILHDVGKIKIPLSILNKPGKLSNVEFDIVKRHVSHGVYLAENTYNISKDAIYAISDHHERYDGLGYPIGLRGEEIHIFGRITSVADVFDALISDRVYRKGYLPYEAYKRVNKQRGKYFDYAVVKALKNVSTNNAKSFLRYG